MIHVRPRWLFILIIVLAAVGMSLISRARLVIDMDITKSLPTDDPVIADSQYVMMHHPIKDRLVIDLGRDEPDASVLVEGALFVEERLTASGLFKSVGLKEYTHLFPDLISHIIANMPALFTEQSLEANIEPLISPGKIRETMAANRSHLLSLQGIGQASILRSDPLGFKDILLRQMAHLVPSTDIRISQGHILSSDGRHLLIIAEPKGSATDTAIARKITSLLNECKSGLLDKFRPRGIVLRLTSIGAYRAALDNEQTAKKDTRRAVLFATVGIALLLLVGFPRPGLGILALVPAIIGTITASLVYSLFSHQISILAVGFGVTIISFTVDYGIAYLLFLDRPYETHGIEASKEVWSLSLLAMLTTAVSFALLFITGFPSLTQIGYFTALGVMFTYIFVHTLFPFIFPTVPPARSEGFRPLRKWIGMIMGSRPRYKVYGAVVIGGIMLLFVRTDFRVDLSAMSTVTGDTLASEKLVTSVWGNVVSRLFLMTEAPSVEELQRKGDQLAEQLDREKEAGVLSTAFVPSMIFPGRERMIKNLSAWKRFWTPARIAVLKKTMREESIETGFTPDAFNPFYEILATRRLPYTGIPERFYSLLGIVSMPDKGSWAQFSVLTPGPEYHAEDFYSRLSASGLAKLFDPSFSSTRLGSLILAGFIKMALIIGAVTTLVALFYLLDLRLTLISMAPTLFALVCTLGTLKLLGRQPGIPAIIVTVIIIGMGTDYALYLVRAYQRYRDESHPSVGLIKLTIFLSAFSTMTGFGVLSFADHALLRSAGLTLLFGIGYSFAGTILIVPPLLGKVFTPGKSFEEESGPVSDKLQSRVEHRYRLMEPYPRIFARFKMRLDPMFKELPALLESYEGIRTLVDIGSGYGVPACWLLERFPRSKVYGIEPDPNRVRIASTALGKRGFVTRGRAPDLPKFPEPADAAFMLDMTHYLTHDELGLTLKRLHTGLRRGGTLVIRTVIPPRRRLPWVWWLENFKLRLSGVPCHYRSLDQMTQIIGHAGFQIEQSAPSGSKGELFWFVVKTKS
jgi:predicted exporter